MVRHMSFELQIVPLVSSPFKWYPIQAIVFVLQFGDFVDIL